MPPARPRTGIREADCRARLLPGTAEWNLPTPPARRSAPTIDDCVWERDPAAFDRWNGGKQLYIEELQISRHGHNRERPATLRRSCRTAHSLQHRGHGSTPHRAEAGETPLRAGLPRRRRLTASGTRPPTPHRAEAGETRFAGGPSRAADGLQHRGHGFQRHIAPKPEKPGFAGGSSAPQTAYSIGDTASNATSRRSRRNPLCGRDFRSADGLQHRGTRLPTTTSRWNRRIPACGRDFRSADGLQHRGHGFQQPHRAGTGESRLRAGLPRRRRLTASGTRLQRHIAPKPENPALRAGLPRRRRLTASGDTASNNHSCWNRRIPLCGRAFCAHAARSVGAPSYNPAPYQDR